LRSLVLLAASVLCTTVIRAAAFDLLGTVRVGNHPEANVVVWLDAPGAPPMPQHERYVLDQRELNFSPHVLAVRVGATVEFPNSDRVYHNVFSFRNGKRFDLGLYPIGSMKRVHFDQPGLSRIFCNIHPHMAAYVMAVESPYFSVSDKTGAFTISSVAPGSYTYHAWRAGGSPLTGSATLDTGARLEIQWP
jgi:plastocyanin